MIDPNLASKIKTFFPFSIKILLLSSCLVHKCILYISCYTQKYLDLSPVKMLHQFSTLIRG